MSKWRSKAQQFVQIVLRKAETIQNVLFNHTVIEDKTEATGDSLDRPIQTKKRKNHTQNISNSLKNRDKESNDELDND